MNSGGATGVLVSNTGSVLCELSTSVLWAGVFLLTAISPQWGVGQGLATLSGSPSFIEEMT